MDDAPFLRLATEEFARTKALADRALAQVADADLHRPPTPGSNSLAVIVKHVAGNLRSRWTDFLTTDGEKPWRRRDAEFEEGAETRAELLALWESAWAVLFDTLGALTEADLARTVRIRTEPHSVTQAILRQVSHYAYHVGQVVAAARAFAGDGWRTLSIARGASSDYDRRMGMKARATE
jgi:uncharacterized damage-inducible protein DinB